MNSWSAVKNLLPSVACVALLAGWSCSAFADLDFNPYVASKAEYISNVFDLSSAEQAVIQRGSTRRADAVMENRVGFDTGYSLSRQHFHFTAEGRRFNYDHFTELDHNEYLLDGGLDWMVTDALNGKLSFRQERRMASFADRQSTQLSLERERKIDGSANLLITPEWRFEVGGRTRKLASPLPGFPAFALSENAGSAGIKYLGFNRLATGLTAEYLAGKYTGVPDATRFDQISLLSETDYIVSGLSTLHLKLGYASRKDRDRGGGTASGFVGSLGYVRQLTGKTSVGIKVFRQIDSYVAGSSSVVATGATIGLTWKATDKITVDASYVYTYSNFKGQGTPGTLTSGRGDHYQYSLLRLTYQALRWLEIRPNLEYEDRHSSVAVAGFNSMLVGLQLRAHF